MISNTNNLLQVSFLSLNNKLLANSLNKKVASLGHLSEHHLINKRGQQYGDGGSERLFISGYYGNVNALYTPDVA